MRPSLLANFVTLMPLSRRMWTDAEQDAKSLNDSEGRTSNVVDGCKPAQREWYKISEQTTSSWDRHNALQCNYKKCLDAWRSEKCTCQEIICLGRCFTIDLSSLHSWANSVNTSSSQKQAAQITVLQFIGIRTLRQFRRMNAVHAPHVRTSASTRSTDVLGKCILTVRRKKDASKNCATCFVQTACWLTRSALLWALFLRGERNYKQVVCTIIFVTM